MLIKMWQWSTLFFLPMFTIIFPAFQENIMHILGYWQIRIIQKSCLYMCYFVWLIYPPPPVILPLQYMVWVWKENYLHKFDKSDKYLIYKEGNIKHPLNVLPLAEV